MRIVVALGGNALLRRGEPLSADSQIENIRHAAEALAPIALKHDLVITHGNGPQVGLLALQGQAFKGGAAFPLDVLDAETEGMIGCQIEQALINALSTKWRVATLLTQIEVDCDDPAFRDPSKPIGPVYLREEAERLADERGWSLRPDGDLFRRVVPSPLPKRILEIDVIRLLVDQGVIVICAGGGGIPVVRRKDGSLLGVEAVIDKDYASALLASELEADALLMLTDVDAVYTKWNTPGARAIRRTNPGALSGFQFAAGSMGPKVDAGCTFVEQTGGISGIGELEDAVAILHGEAGTMITKDADGIDYWD
jgi:carbamate kinase